MPVKCEQSSAQIFGVALEFFYLSCRMFKLVAQPEFDRSREDEQDTVTRAFATSFFKSKENSVFSH